MKATLFWEGQDSQCAGNHLLEHCGQAVAIHTELGDLGKLHTFAAMANPRIEEVSDDEDFDDPDEMDVDAFDFAKPKTGGLQSSVSDLPEKMQALLRESQAPPPSTASASRPSLPAGMSDKDREQFQRAKLEESKRHQCIYPVYFDSTRSREEGRRVKKEDSVANPLAREIVDALSHIGTTMQVPLQIVFEPSKTHPKDWANPGRVKVLIKKDGRAVNSKIKNSKACGRSSLDGRADI